METNKISIKDKLIYVNYLLNEYSNKETEIIHLIDIILKSNKKSIIENRIIDTIETTNKKHLR